MSCAELFGYNGGDEWMVSHYLFRNKKAAAAAAVAAPAAPAAAAVVGGRKASKRA
jgi:hypothetical protein